MPNELPRRLGLCSAIAVVIGSTIGSGIFRSPAGIADRLPGPLPLLAVWVAGGLFALCGALTLAEVAGALPRTGGLYVFIREGWGRAPRVPVRVGGAGDHPRASLGAISTTFAEYFLRVLGLRPGAWRRTTTTCTTRRGGDRLTAAFNYRRRPMGRAGAEPHHASPSTAGCCSSSLLAFAVGLPADGRAFHPGRAAGELRLGAFGLALVSVLWAFDGWADLSFVAGEVKDPRRNLPRALILGTLAVIVIYLLANLAYLAVFPVEQMRTSPLIAADVAQRLHRRRPAWCSSASR